MSWDGSPPEEAYGRVTNPERFNPLHPFAEQLLVQLDEEYAVERVEGYGLDVQEEGIELARPTIKLTPHNTNSAPITLIFTAPYGLIMRVGLLCVRTFPLCSCDACGETFETESENLMRYVEWIVAGVFEESVQLDDLNGVTYSHKFEHVNEYLVSRGDLEFSVAEEVLGGRRHRDFKWEAWQKIA